MYVFICFLYRKTNSMHNYNYFYCQSGILRNIKIAILLTSFTILITLFLQSCASFIPVEVQNGRALGIMPMQYGRISYQGTHKVSGTREDIFRQVRRWSAFHSTRTIYTSALTTLKIPAPTNAFYVGDNLLGDVITSGVIEPIPKANNTTITWPATHYSVSVECYDGYYRITLTNFYTFSFPSPHYLDVRDKSTSLKTTKEYYSQVDTKVMSLITELETFVKSEIGDGK